jgi:galactokinase
VEQRVEQSVEQGPEAGVVEEFVRRYGEQPAFVVRAPGRVNLIGEHTDYNEGFVLPMAIDRAVFVALRGRGDRRVALRSLDFPDSLDFSLDEIERGAGWGEYAKGIAWSLQEAGRELQGWEGVVGGDVPIGAGLSSSAALELALCSAFACVSQSQWDGQRDGQWDGTAMAKLARRAEGEWVGVQSGIMDQLVAAEGKGGSALLIDCRSTSITPVALPEDLRVVVLDTGTRRELGSSAYNERVAQCRAAAECLGVQTLRDLTRVRLEAGAAELDGLLLRRARHVVSENIRTLHAVQALQQGDLAALGRLVNESHASLRDDYEVSSSELDTITEIARAGEGCLGARMTGAGFGGCAIALVSADRAKAFAEEVAGAYREATGLEPQLYLCRATDGAAVTAALS